MHDSRLAQIFVLAASTLVSSLVLTSRQTPLLIYNASQSVPTGMYSIDHSQPNRGDLVLVRPWPELARLLAKHDILPPGVPLLKTVAAATDDNVCRNGFAIIINGILAAKILDSDAKGQALSGWSSCRKLVRGELFLLRPHPRSFDSRYFGPALSCDVIGIARPIEIPIIPPDVLIASAPAGAIPGSRSQLGVFTSLTAEKVGTFE